jgi:hypothetical protein
VKASRPTVLTRTAKAVSVAEVKRLHWRIWNGKAKNAKRSIKRIRKVMHVFKGEHSQGAKGVPSRKLWHALRVPEGPRSPLSSHLGS